jgi:hypothetical protein
MISFRAPYLALTAVRVYVASGAAAGEHSRADSPGTQTAGVMSADNFRRQAAKPE